MLSGGFIAAVCLCVAFLAVASSKLGTSVQHSGNGGKLADAWHAQMLSSAQKLVPQPQGCLQNCLASCARKRNSYFDHDLVQTAECNRFRTTPEGSATGPAFFRKKDQTNQQFVDQLYKLSLRNKHVVAETTLGNDT